MSSPDLAIIEKPKRKRTKQEGRKRALAEAKEEKLAALRRQCDELAQSRDDLFDSWLKERSLLERRWEEASTVARELREQLRQATDTLASADAKAEVIKAQRDGIIAVQKLEIEALRHQLAARQDEWSGVVTAGGGSGGSPSRGVSQAAAGANVLESQVKALQQELHSQKDEFWALQVAKQEVVELRVMLREATESAGDQKNCLTKMERETDALRGERDRQKDEIACLQAARNQAETAARVAIDAREEAVREGAVAAAKTATREMSLAMERLAEEAGEVEVYRQEKGNLCATVEVLRSENTRVGALAKRLRQEVDELRPREEADEEDEEEEGEGGGGGEGSGVESGAHISTAARQAIAAMKKKEKRLAAALEQQKGKVLESKQKRLKDKARHGAAMQLAAAAVADQLQQAFMEVMESSHLVETLQDQVEMLKHMASAQADSPSQAKEAQEGEDRASPGKAAVELISLQKDLNAAKKASKKSSAELTAASAGRDMLMREVSQKAVECEEFRQLAQAKEEVISTLHAEVTQQWQGLRDQASAHQSKVQELETKLKASREGVEGRMDSSKAALVASEAALATAQSSLREMEAGKQSLEGQVAKLEAQVVKAQFASDMQARGLREMTEAKQDLETTAAVDQAKWRKSAEDLQRKLDEVVQGSREEASQKNDNRKKKKDKEALPGSGRPCTGTFAALTMDLMGSVEVELMRRHGQSVAFQTKQGALQTEVQMAKDIGGEMLADMKEKRAIIQALEEHIQSMQEVAELREEGRSDSKRSSTPRFEDVDAASRPSTGRFEVRGTK